LLNAKIYTGHECPGTNLNFEVLNRYQSKSFVCGMTCQTEQPEVYLKAREVPKIGLLTN
ncbi:MAG: hypothetical protein RL068_636, partial [Actinomycetota bacterium]